MLSGPQQSILQHLRRSASLSRGELAEAMNLRPNTAGQAVAGLIAHRLVREDRPDRSRAGRPRVPVRIDPYGREVIGIALTAQGIHTATLNPLGRATGQPIHRGSAPGRAAHVAGELLRERITDRTWAVGIAAPGIVDRDERALTLTGITSGTIPLGDLIDAAGDVPVVLDNDMHALAARWWLTVGRPALCDAGPSAGDQGEAPGASEDVLLVRLGDGALGASLLIDGRPNHGCVIGGNELGHTRMPVATPRCYCGHVGCLERIASTAFLHQRGGSSIRTLAELCSAWPSGNPADDAAVSAMLDLLAIGLGNAVNFIRPHRLVLVSEFSRYPAFLEAFGQRLQAQLLPGIAGRAAMERWDHPLTTPGETAAYLALAGLYDTAWLR